LKQRINSLEKTRETQEEKCQTYSSELNTVKQQLRDTSEVCQQLLAKLDRESKTSVPTTETESKMQRVHATSQPSGSSDSAYLTQENTSLREQNTALLSENKDLQKQMKQLVETNTRWQQYNEQREKHVRELQALVQEMQDKIESTQNNIPPDRQQQIEQMIHSAQQQAEAAEQEKNRVQRVNQQLQQVVNDQERKLQEMEAQLQAALARGPHGQRPEDRDRIHMLEAQVQICTEDFESERQDRERAQKRIADLEQELSLHKRQLEQFQTNHMTRLYQQRMASLAQYRQEHASQHGYAGIPQSRLVARGVEADGGGDDHTPADDEDCVDTIFSVSKVSTDSGPSSRGSDTDRYESIPTQRSITTDSDVPRSATDNSSRMASLSEAQRRMEMMDVMDESGSNKDTAIYVNTEHLKQDTLHCPRCNREFSQAKHKDLVEHIDECCN